MDLKTTIASVPILRKAWRVIPGPLRIPLLLIGAVVWLYKRGDDEAREDAADEPART